MKKGFWSYLLIVKAIIIFLIIMSYFGWFFLYLKRDLSESGEQWGQFGDFFGGILNPLLSFITICILIKTSLYQENQVALTEKRELNKRFDDRFYGMVSQLNNNFERFKFHFNKDGVWSASKLLSFMEDMVFNSRDVVTLHQSIYKQAVFPMLRQFYLMLKMINDENDKGNLNNKEVMDYYIWLINCTEYDILRFIVFSVYYYDDVKASSYIIECDGFISELRSLGFSKYIDSIIESKKIANSQWAKT